MKIGFIESIKKSVFVAVEHADESYGSKKGDNRLQGQVKSCKIGSFDNVGVFIAEFELIE